MILLTEITLTQALTGLAFVVTLISSIWVLFERVQKKFSETVDRKVDDALSRNNKIQDERILNMMEKLDNNSAERVRNIAVKLDTFMQDQQENNNKQDIVLEHQSKAIIEAYKQSIRTIYYRLRETGEITNADKAYLDKIFPYYVMLGGNSDIKAKYDEICRVYERRTQEAYDKARENQKKKGKATRTVDIDNQEPDIKE